MSKSHALADYKPLIDQFIFLNTSPVWMISLVDRSEGLSEYMGITQNAVLAQYSIGVSVNLPCWSQSASMHVRAPFDLPPLDHVLQGEECVKLCSERYDENLDLFKGSRPIFEQFLITRPLSGEFLDYRTRLLISVEIGSKKISFVGVGLES